MNNWIKVQKQCNISSNGNRKDDKQAAVSWLFISLHRSLISFKCIKAITNFKKIPVAIGQPFWEITMTWMTGKKNNL